ncbi:Fe-S biogenesis protein NfuA [Sodalis sp. CWE]|uniref:Fe-S biogenesis protein NfuA n=1 Tax=Sodalis sp. CWE TaxID=2803816 RepID=UPI001C7D4D63|nr:Fe-S biogenesis protein NfuA [Sodalis sp. CWE]MBX4181124.1 Fe-S biogenesis protein NfuA [Sodalis sp. CWE]
MIQITEVAKEHFIKLLVNQQPGTHIRVFVINPETPNAECGISYCPSGTVENTDIELKFGKFSVYIDKLSVPYLQDAKIDLIKENLESQLTIKAPNIKLMNKADTNLSLADRVEYFIHSQINPKLAFHGGQITLVEINNDMLAVLKFSGGCNGCLMAGYTLKEGIEKKLLARFPELKGVSDFTEHQRGEHSYYK